MGLMEVVDLYKIKIKLLLKRMLSPEINPGEYVTIVGKVKQILVILLVVLLVVSSPFYQMKKIIYQTKFN